MKKITSLVSIQKKVADQTNTLKDKATEASSKLGDLADLRKTKRSHRRGKYGLADCRKSWIQGQRTGN
jgi:hypothetical protein